MCIIDNYDVYCIYYICDCRFSSAILRVYQWSKDILMDWKFVMFDFILLNDLQCVENARFLCVLSLVLIFELWAKCSSV
jgi:hypothetical protein